MRRGRGAKDCGTFDTREELERFVLWCYDNTRAPVNEIADAAKINYMTAHRVVDSRPVVRQRDLVDRYRDGVILENLNRRLMGK